MSTMCGAWYRIPSSRENRHNKQCRRPISVELEVQDSRRAERFFDVKGKIDYVGLVALAVRVSKMLFVLFVEILVHRPQIPLRLAAT